MEYHCISADSHIDLCWLPHDLFVANATHAQKECMPYVIEGSDGPLWVTKSGLKFGYANGKGGSGAVGIGTKYVKGKEGRADRIADTGLYSDGTKGIFRPTTPELRLQDQDRDGIQAEVMYGLLGVGKNMTGRVDGETLVEFYRIYNDWLSDFCSYDRKRLVGLAAIASHDVDQAVAEVRRVAKLGLGGLEVATTYDMVPLSDPDWDPLWRAAAEVNLPVHFHEIGKPPGAPVPASLPDAYKQAREATRVAQTKMSMAAILASVIHGGALERYPALRIVFGESDIGWISYVLERMDYKYEDKFKGRIPLKSKPSDYWHRQCRATFQNDRIGAKHLDDLGVENVMWASDYPHTDGVFPDSQEHIQRQFTHLSSTALRKITCENAGKFYGLMTA